MIERLTGTVARRGPTDVVLDVNGVGYELQVTLATSEAVPALGQRATLLCHLHFFANDASVRLFGFATEEERRLFRLLLPIKGVGPSTAQRILSSGRSPSDVAAAIASGDPKKIRAKGVGAKLAERVALELRDKLGGFSVPAGVPRGGAGRRLDAAAEDAFLALRQLEFDEGEARALVEKARASLPEATADELVREGLRHAG